MDTRTQRPRGLRDLPLQACDDALFYARRDANDVRLGEIVGRQSERYADADVVIVGCPQDEGVRRNGGRAGAARGPAEIRRALYRLTGQGLDGLRLFDAGDTVIQPTLEQTHDAHRGVVRRLLEDGKRVVVLGGGNDISWPDVGALAAVHASPLVFNIDAHFDVRVAATASSGTPYRQLLEEGIVAPARFIELGGQPFANSPVYADYLRKKRVQVVDLATARRKGVAAAATAVLKRQRGARAVFWGFDLDVVDAAFAPGVSAPNPCGMTSTEFCALATAAGGEARTRVVEFSEVNPVFDVDARTSRLAAAAIYHYFSALTRVL